MEDVTGKTDYDTIGGTDNVLRLVQIAGGDPRTVAEAKDIKGLQLRWSDDGRTFAYAKKGEVFVQRIDETKPRSLTPPPPKEDAGKESEAPAKDADKDAKDEKESFAVGPFARDASKLVITSKIGWYVVDVATGARVQVVTLSDDEEKNPRIEALEVDARRKGRARDVRRARPVGARPDAARCRDQGHDAARERQPSFFGCSPGEDRAALRVLDVGWRPPGRSARRARRLFVDEEVDRSEPVDRRRGTDKV